MHKTKAPTPFDGVPGISARLNRFLFPILGPAQIGIGRPEAPYVPPKDPRCPMCGELMAEHRIDRGNASTPTYVRCPTPPG